MPGGWFKVPNSIKGLVPLCDGKTDAGYVFVTLCRFSNGNDEDKCWPSVALMQEETGLSDRQIQRMLKLLESKDCIRIERRNGSNIYTILFGKGDTQSPPTTSHRHTVTPGDMESPPPPTRSHPPVTHCRPNKKQDQQPIEQETKNKRAAPDMRVPPDPKDVREYFAQIGAPEEAKAYWDFYESNGWHVGKNKMVKWRAAASGWVNRAREKNGHAPSLFEQEHHPVTAPTREEIDRERQKRIEDQERKARDLEEINRAVARLELKRQAERAANIVPGISEG